MVKVYDILIKNVSGMYASHVNLLYLELIKIVNIITIHLPACVCLCHGTLILYNKIGRLHPTGSIHLILIKLL